MKSILWGSVLGGSTCRLLDLELFLSRGYSSDEVLALDPICAGITLAYVVSGCQDKMREVELFSSGHSKGAYGDT